MLGRLDQKAKHYVACRHGIKSVPSLLDGVLVFGFQGGIIRFHVCSGGVQSIEAICLVLNGAKW